MNKFILATIPTSDGSGYSMHYNNTSTQDHHTRLINHVVDYYNLFDIQSIDDIPIGKKYCMYVNVYNDFIHTREHTWYSWMRFNDVEPGITRHDVFHMPSRIWNDSAKGLVHWIIDYSTESDLDRMIDFNKLIIGLNCGHHRQNITLLTAAETDYSHKHHVDYLMQTYGINIITQNILHGFCDYRVKPETKNFITQKLNNIINNEPHSFKSVCYNRRPRRHRAVIIAHMMKKNYLSESIYSFGDGNNMHCYVDPEEFYYLRNELTFLQNSDIITPVKEKDIDLTENQAGVINLTHGLDSMFHIVTETVSNQFTFITEKSYKPFFMLQPFIMYGNQYNVQRLRDMGFDVFDDWIDHSYDNIKNDIDRLRVFLTELDRLHSLSHDTWIQMLNNMTDSLLYNHHHVTKDHNQYPVKLYNILFKFYN